MTEDELFARRPLGMRMAMVVRQWRAIIDSAITDTGLTQSSWTVLMQLHQLGDNVSVSELAEVQGIELPPLMRTLSLLEKQGYLVPVTSMVAMYTPEVEKISTQSGKTYVTVGYIPTINNSSSGEINLTAPTEPTKYMDYVFTRGEGRKWYLSALQESDMQPEVSASTAAPTTDSGDPQELVQNNLDSTVADTGNPTGDTADGTAEPDSTADDQTVAQSEPEADTGDTGGDTQDSSGTE